MATVFDSDLSGQLSRRTLLVYKLDPTGTFPIEPILDLVPGITINRITADLIESEAFTQTSSVTENTVSNFTTATTNSRRDLQTLQVNVLFTSIIQPGSSMAVVPAVETPDSVRADLIRIRNLINLQGQNLPVAVYTPRWGMPRAFIESVSCPWDITLGTNTRATIAFKEARLLSLERTAFVNDYDEQSSGANKKSGGGNSPTTDTQVSEFENVDNPLNAPTVG
jgi:hypothetical protein